MTKMTSLLYVATENMFVNNQIVQAGAEFRYDGLPSANMIPTCDEGQKRRKAAEEWDKKGRFDNPAPTETNPGLAEAQQAAVAKAKAKASQLSGTKKVAAEEELA